VELLLVVEENPGIGVQEAAAALQVAANTVSTLVNQLVVAGLLARTRDESDRRSAHLHLTPRAKARFETWRDRRLEALEAAMGTLSPAERRRIEQAVPALRKVMASLQGMP
jgi:DNA-binding MarR family transcriptional regulator